MSFPSSSEKLDYSGDDDVDLDDVHPAPDTNKHSHLVEEKIQIAAPIIEPQSKETSIVEGILSFFNHYHHPTFFSSDINTV